MTTRRVRITAALLLHLFAPSLHSQITQQTLSRPTPQARQQLTQMLQEYREKKDLHNEALTLLQLGIADAGLGNVDAARSDFVDAARKMRAKNDFVGAWLALMALSQLEVALGRPADAIAHLEKSLTIINEAKTSTAPFALKTFMAFGSIAGLSPQMLESLDERNVALMKPVMLQSAFEPMTHDLYGSVLTLVGQLEKAEAELKLAAAGSVYSQGMYDFSIEAHFGDLRFRQQRYDEARTHYIKALNASSRMAQLSMDDHPIKAGIYDRLTRLETMTGHPEEAKRWSERARELGKKHTEGH